MSLLCDLRYTKWIEQEQEQAEERDCVHMTVIEASKSATNTTNQFARRVWICCLLQIRREYDKGAFSNSAILCSAMALLDNYLMASRFMNKRVPPTPMDVALACSFIASKLHRTDHLSSSIVKNASLVNRSHAFNDRNSLRDLEREILERVEFNIPFPTVHEIRHHHMTLQFKSAHSSVHWILEFLELCWLVSDYALVILPSEVVLFSIVLAFHMHDDVSIRASVAEAVAQLRPDQFSKFTTFQQHFNAACEPQWNCLNKFYQSQYMYVLQRRDALLTVIPQTIMSTQRLQLPQQSEHQLSTSTTASTTSTATTTTN